MPLDPFEVALITVGGLGAAWLWWAGRPALLNGRGHLPRRFTIRELDATRIPLDARQPLAYLSERLAACGFEPAGVPSLVGRVRRLLLVPFVHLEERALFLMGIESRPLGPSQIMLHIISPLGGGRRVETTTLQGLESLVQPVGVEAGVVLDADTVEEIWSRHRRALTRHPRDLRLPIDPGEWPKYVEAAYEDWLRAALRARVLKLDSSGERYRIDTRTRRP